MENVKAKEVKVRAVVEYGGHSLSANGSVNFTVKADYSELSNVIQMMQMLNEDISVRVRVPGRQPMALGMFRLKQITIGGDGASKVRLNGLNDFIEMDNLNLLPTANEEDDPRFAILMVAEIALEDGGEEEGGE